MISKSQIIVLLILLSMGAMGQSGENLSLEIEGEWTLGDNNPVVVVGNTIFCGEGEILRSCEYIYRSNSIEVKHIKSTAVGSPITQLTVVGDYLIVTTDGFGNLLFSTNVSLSDFLTPLCRFGDSSTYFKFLPISDTSFYGVHKDGEYKATKFNIKNSANANIEVESSQSHQFKIEMIPKDAEFADLTFDGEKELFFAFNSASDNLNVLLRIHLPLNNSSKCDSTWTRKVIKDIEIDPVRDRFYVFCDDGVYESLLDDYSNILNPGSPTENVKYVRNVQARNLKPNDANNESHFYFTGLTDSQIYIFSSMYKDSDDNTKFGITAIDSMELADAHFYFDATRGDEKIFVTKVGQRNELLIYDLYEYDEDNWDTYNSLKFKSKTSETYRLREIQKNVVLNECTANKNFSLVSRDDEIYAIKNMEWVLGYYRAESNINQLLSLDNSLICILDRECKILKVPSHNISFALDYINTIPTNETILKIASNSTSLFISSGDEIYKYEIKDLEEVTTKTTPIISGAHSDFDVNEYGIYLLGQNGHTISYYNLSGDFVDSLGLTGYEFEDIKVDYNLLYACHEDNYIEVFSTPPQNTLKSTNWDSLLADKYQYFHARGKYFYGAVDENFLVYDVFDTNSITSTPNVAMQNVTAIAFAEDTLFAVSNDKILNKLVHPNSFKQNMEFLDDSFAVADYGFLGETLTATAKAATQRYYISSHGNPDIFYQFTIDDSIYSQVIEDNNNNLIQDFAPAQPDTYSVQFIAQANSFNPKKHIIDSTEAREVIIYDQLPAPSLHISNGAYISEDEIVFTCDDTESTEIVITYDDQFSSDENIEFAIYSLTEAGEERISGFDTAYARNILLNQGSYKLFAKARYKGREGLESEPSEIYNYHKSSLNVNVEYLDVCGTSYDSESKTLFIPDGDDWSINLRLNVNTGYPGSLSFVGITTNDNSNHELNYLDVTQQASVGSVIQITSESLDFPNANAKLIIVADARKSCAQLMSCDSSETFNDGDDIADIISGRQNSDLPVPWKFNDKETNYYGIQYFEIQEVNIPEPIIKFPATPVLKDGRVVIYNDQKLEATVEVPDLPEKIDVEELYDYKYFMNGNAINENWMPENRIDSIDVAVDTVNTFSIQVRNNKFQYLTSSANTDVLAGNVDLALLSYSIYRDEKKFEYIAGDTIFLPSLTKFNISFKYNYSNTFLDNTSINVPFGFTPTWNARNDTSFRIISENIERNLNGGNYSFESENLSAPSFKLANEYSNFFWFVLDCRSSIKELMSCDSSLVWNDENDIANMDADVYNSLDSLSVNWAFNDSEIKMRGVYGIPVKIDSVSDPNLKVKIDGTYQSVESFDANIGDTIEFNVILDGNEQQCFLDHDLQYALFKNGEQIEDWQQNSTFYVVCNKLELTSEIKALVRCTRNIYSNYSAPLKLNILPKIDYLDSLIVVNQKEQYLTIENDFESSGIKEAKLYYRVTGDTAYDSVTFHIKPEYKVPYHMAMIPNKDLTLRGLEYYIKITDGGNKLITLPHNRNSEKPQIVQLEFHNFEFPENKVTVSESYYLFSIPGIISYNNKNAFTNNLFKTYNNKDWRLYKFNTSNQENVEWSENSNFITIQPSHTFWLTTREPTRIAIDTIKSVRPDTEFSVAFRSGFSQISNPYDFPINWQAIRKENCEIGEYLHRFDSEIDAWSDKHVQIMQPWEGYYAEWNTKGNSASDCVIKFSLRNNPDLLNLADTINVENLEKSKLLDWGVDLSLTDGKFSNSINLGKIKDGIESLNFEFSLPPHPTERFVAGAVEPDHLDNVQRTQILQSHKYLLPNEEGAFRLIVMSTDISRRVKITLDNFFGKISDKRIVIGDSENNFTTILAPDKNYYFYPKSKFHIINVYVGSEDYLKRQGLIVDTAPKDYELAQNFPNPFNPVTSIPFSVKEAIHVKLIVYNIMGQVVEVLVDETKVPGEYEVKFDSKNHTNGIYFYHIEMGKFFQTRKMTILK